jgi:hypothetical protein
MTTEMDTRTYTDEEIQEHRIDLYNALKSGKYTQGHNQLLTIKLNGEEQKEFCCLGVACDISGLGVWRRMTRSPDRPVVEEYRVNDIQFDHALLPTPVATYYGWDGDRDPYIYGNNEGPRYQGMSQFNDNLGWTFEQLAEGLKEEYIT